jgi:ATP-dependent DNA helicase PIF1
MSNFTLSPEQQLSIDRFTEGGNIFITGPGGAGKSEIIKTIYQLSIHKYKKISVTAMTGTAADMLHCGGRTLHSCTGIGIGRGNVDDLVKKIRSNKKASAFWKFVHVLVVDEVSMLDMHLFQKLDKIGQRIRHSSEPFGGIQLVFSGDFYQLPPIGERGDAESKKFCFQCPEWNQIFRPRNQIQLTHIFRQTDSTYINVLNQVRVGVIKKKSVAILEKCVGKKIDPDLVSTPTRLFPVRYKVDQINQQSLNAITGETHIFRRTTNTVISDTATSAEKKIRKDCWPSQVQSSLEMQITNLRCDETIHLKVGAHVMCIVNMEDELGNIELCNGSQGIITSFCSETTFPLVQFTKGGEPKRMVPYEWASEIIPGVTVSQIPIILSWALTIHKSQGATLSAAEMDIGSSVFSDGQTYVALSRVKDLEGLYLREFDVTKIKVNRAAQIFYTNLDQLHYDDDCIHNLEMVEKEIALAKIKANQNKQSTISQYFQPTTAS